MLKRKEKWKEQVMATFDDNLKLKSIDSCTKFDEQFLKVLWELIMHHIFLKL